MSELQPQDPTDERFGEVTSQRLADLWLLRAAAVEVTPALAPYQDRLLSWMMEAGSMPQNPVKPLVNDLALEALATEEEAVEFDPLTRRQMVDEQIGNDLSGLLYIFAAGAAERDPQYLT